MKSVLDSQSFPPAGDCGPAVSGDLIALAAGSVGDRDWEGFTSSERAEIVLSLEEAVVLGDAPAFWSQELVARRLLRGPDRARFVSELPWRAHETAVERGLRDGDGEASVADDRLRHLLLSGSALKLVARHVHERRPVAWRRLAGTLWTTSGRSERPKVASSHGPPVTWIDEP